MPSALTEENFCSKPCLPILFANYNEEHIKRLFKATLTLTFLIIFLYSEDVL